MLTLDLRDCTFSGPAFPEPFVRYELSATLTRLGLLHDHGRTELERNWSSLRRQLRSVAGPQSVCNHVLAPLGERLGFAAPLRQPEVATRECIEDGGWLMHAPCGASLRAWSFATETDLDAPQRTGRAYRFSPMRCAQRVLLATGERLGLLSDGNELRLLLCDPVRPDSHIAIPLTGAAGWQVQALAPDSYRLVLALGTPKGIAALSEVLDAARLSQTRVTRDLRTQARQAIEGFLQCVLDHRTNRHICDCSAQVLWQEALILVYRLLFILKLESAGDPGCAFSFASTDLWRNSLSPNRALGPLVRRVVDHGVETGRMLEDGLRLLFRAFRDGLACSELVVTPLGGALFGARTTPLLDRLTWGERAVALLLDRLLWTKPKGRARERVHYGALDVEDLGRVYEALLELEPGITSAPMSRLRRAKLDVILPSERTAKYRNGNGEHEGTHVAWVEDIPKGRFFLRAGIGRKASGSYYTPHAFVRYLVRETLAPRIASCSPDNDPNPSAILALKVVDPATGSGHFLVEACRFLGEALYVACRACDELAASAEEQAVGARADESARLLARAATLRSRVAALPDPDRLLLAYLPSRASEGGASGLSQSRATAICRRMVAVHCLYGVDSNRLAVELAKLSLWLESYAEGLPLTFLDHQLVRGDAVTGPCFASLATLPVGGKELDPLLARNVAARLHHALRRALREVVALQATVGANAADLALKELAKHRLDEALEPLRLLSRAWSGAMMIATQEMDDEWLALANAVAESGTWPPRLTARQSAMLAVGQQALPWDLTFPEVFWTGESCTERAGFDAVLSNPPWDIMQPSTTEFLAGYDLSILDAVSTREVHAIRNRLLADSTVADKWRDYQASFAHKRRVVERLYEHQRYGVEGAAMGGKLDLYRVFAERMLRLLSGNGAIGMVVPSAFHANEGATGLRKLYLREAKLEQCLSFENQRKLFDIDGRFKFALVIARRPGPTRTVSCAFYLTDVLQIADASARLDYAYEFIRKAGGEYLTFLELRQPSDVPLALRMFSQPPRFGTWTKEKGIFLSREIHMTDDAGTFVPAQAGRCKRLCLLHEGKTIHQFTDRWLTPPRYAIRLTDLARKPHSLYGMRFFRAACREIAGATNERTAIAAMLPPGTVCGHTISVERRPGHRPNATALGMVALINSFAFDWLLRQRAAAHVSLYLLQDLPVPGLGDKPACCLAHAALRLCCNHAGFAPLWREQLGDAWREDSPRPRWPVIASATDRWLLRAVIDAIVAHAYGLRHKHYERILASFSHKSFPDASAMCMAAFDELSGLGMARFCRQHDPYFDIPLVSAPAKPAIELPGSCQSRDRLGPPLAGLAPGAYLSTKHSRRKQSTWKRKASTSL
jgi:hypothetical protein